MKTALRFSNLPTGQILANFDFAFQLAIERSRIETLAISAWVRGAETVLIQGPPGAGKTHLTVRLGMKSVEQGRTRGSRDREEGRGVEPLPSHLGTLLSYKTTNCTYRLLLHWIWNHTEPDPEWENNWKQPTKKPLCIE